MHTLPGPTPTLVASGAPVFQVNHRLRRTTLPAITKAAAGISLEVANHVLHAVGMAVAMSMVMYSGTRRATRLVHRVVVGLFHPQEIDA